MATFMIGASLAEELETDFEDVKDFAEFYLKTSEEDQIFRNWAEHMVLRASRFLQCSTDEDFMSSPQRIVKTFTELAKPPLKRDAGDDEAEEEKKNEQEEDFAEEEEDPDSSKPNIVRLLSSFHPSGRAIIAGVARSLAVAKLLIILTACNKRLLESWKAMLKLEKQLRKNLGSYLIETEKSKDVALAGLYGKIFFKPHFLLDLTPQDEIFPGESYLELLKKLGESRSTHHKLAIKYCKFPVAEHKAALQAFFVTIFKLAQSADESSKITKILIESLSSCDQEFQAMSSTSGYSVNRVKGLEDEYAQIAHNVVKIVNHHVGEVSLTVLQNALTSVMQNLIKCNPYIIHVCMKWLSKSAGFRKLTVDATDKELTAPMHLRKNLLDMIATHTAAYQDAAVLGISSDICRIPDDILQINIQDGVINVPEASDFELVLSSYSKKIECDLILKNMVLNRVFGIVPNNTYSEKTLHDQLAKSFREAVTTGVEFYMNDIVKVYFESELFLAKTGWQLQLAKKTLDKIFRNLTIGFSRLYSTGLRMIGVATGNKSTKIINQVRFGVFYRNSTIHPSTDAVCKPNYAPLFQAFMDKPNATRNELSKEAETLLASFLNHVVQLKISCFGIGGSDWASEELEMSIKKIFSISKLGYYPRVRSFTSECCGLYSLVSSLTPPESCGHFQREFFRIATGISIATEWGAMGVTLEAIKLQGNDGSIFTLEDLDPACGRNILPDADKDNSIKVKHGILFDHIKRCEVDANLLMSYTMCPIVSYVLDISLKRTTALYARAKAIEEDRLNQEIWRMQMGRGSRCHPCPFSLTMDIPSTLVVPESVVEGLTVGKIMLKCLSELHIDYSKMITDALKSLKLGEKWLKKNSARLFLSQVEVRSKEGINLDFPEFLALSCVFPIPSVMWEKLVEMVLERVSDATVTNLASAAIVNNFKKAQPGNTIRTTLLLGLLGKVMNAQLQDLNNYGFAIMMAINSIQGLQVNLPSVYFSGKQRSPTQDSAMENTQLFSTDLPSMSSRFLSTMAFAFKHTLNLVYGNNFTVVDRLTLGKDEGRLEKLEKYLPSERCWNNLTAQEMIRYSDLTESRIDSIDEEAKILISGEGFQIPKSGPSTKDETTKLLERRVGTLPRLSFVLSDLFQFMKSGWGACNFYRDEAYTYATVFCRERKVYFNSQEYRVPFKYQVLQLEVANKYIKSFNQKSYLELLGSNTNTKLLDKLKSERIELIKEINKSIAVLKDSTRQPIKPRIDELVLIPDYLYLLRPLKYMYVRVMAHPTTDPQLMHMGCASEKMFGRAINEKVPSRPAAIPGSISRGGAEGLGGPEFQRQLKEDESENGGGKSGKENENQEQLEQIQHLKKEVTIPKRCLQPSIQGKALQSATCKKIHSFPSSARSFIPASFKKANQCTAECRPFSAASPRKTPCPAGTRPLSGTCKKLNPVVATKSAKVVKKSPSLVVQKPLVKKNRQMDKMNTGCNKKRTMLEFSPLQSSLESIRSSSSKINLNLEDNKTGDIQECDSVEYDIFAPRK